MVVYRVVHASRHEHFDSGSCHTTSWSSASPFSARGVFCRLAAGAISVDISEFYMEGHTSFVNNGASSVGGEKIYAHWYVVLIHEARSKDSRARIPYLVRSLHKHESGRLVVDNSVNLRHDLLDAGYIRNIGLSSKLELVRSRTPASVGCLYTTLTR